MLLNIDAVPCMNQANACMLQEELVHYYSSTMYAATLQCTIAVFNYGWSGPLWFLNLCCIKCHA